MRIRKLNEKHEGETDWYYELRLYGRPYDEFIVADIADDISQREDFPIDCNDLDENFQKNLQLMKISKDYLKKTEGDSYNIVKVTVHVLTDEEIEIEISTNKYNL